MAQALARVNLHLIFSTKNRHAYLNDEALRRDLYSYQCGILRILACSPMIVNGMPDHVHLLFEMTRTASISEVVEEVKRSSSKWVKRVTPALGDFSWQRGYAVFSVSVTNADSVRAYIENQVEHHRVRSHEEEMREFFRAHAFTDEETSYWE